MTWGKRRDPAERTSACRARGGFIHGCFALTLALIATACHDSASTSACGEGGVGGEGCPCADNSPCTDGLTCTDGVCVAAPPPGDASLADVLVFDAATDTTGRDDTAPLEDTAPPDDTAPPSDIVTGCTGEVVGDFCPCRESADCASGYCLPSSEGGNVCSRPCAGTCPDDFACLLVTLPGGDPTYLCVEPALNLCRPCNEDSECQRDTFGASGARCVHHGDALGSFCGTACSADEDCPDAYACREVVARATGGRIRQCVPSEPEAGCSCSGRSIADAAFTTCEGYGCTGTRRCEEGGLTACTTTEEALCEPAVTVEVTFDPQGGVLVGDATRTAFFGQPYGTLPSATRAGYDLDGWRTAPAGAGELVTASTRVTEGLAHTLYAAWRGRSYTVTFLAAGGSDCEARTVTFGMPYGAGGALCTPTRRGHDFDGWWREDGAGGEAITDATLVATAGDHALTARWRVKTLTVRFDSKGGSACPSHPVTFGQAYGGPARSLCVPNWAGWSFAGWRTGDNGTGEAVTDASIVALETDHTLYAAWVGNRYTVSFDAQGGRPESIDPREVTFGSAYGELAAPTRRGHAFAGWWTAVGGGVEVRAATVVNIVGDHRLFARWTVTVTGVSAVRLHIPGAAMSRARPATTWFRGSAAHGSPTGRSSNGSHRLHFGFHPGRAH